MFILRTLGLFKWTVPHVPCWLPIGFSAVELRSIGFSIQEFVAAFTAVELKDVGFTLEDLVAASVSVAQLKDCAEHLPYSCMGPIWAIWDPYGPGTNRQTHVDPYGPIRTHMGSIWVCSGVGRVCGKFDLFV